MGLKGGGLALSHFGPSFNKCSMMYNCNFVAVFVEWFVKKFNELLLLARRWNKCAENYVDISTKLCDNEAGKLK